MVCSVQLKHSLAVFCCFASDALSGKVASRDAEIQKLQASIEQLKAEYNERAEKDRIAELEERV